jgi:hypothetical protein
MNKFLSATYRDGLRIFRDGIFATRPCDFPFQIKYLWRVGTGRDGFLRYLPLRARDQGNGFNPPYPSLPSLAGAPQ